jgi:transglutaminase-like putative cysteine protease
MRGTSKLLILMVALVVLVSALSGAFLALAMDPLPYEPAPGSGPGLLPAQQDNLTAPRFENELSVEKRQAGNDPLFAVSGNTGLRYLRNAVYNHYEDGWWTFTLEDYAQYSGETITLGVPENAGWESQTIRIQPLKDFFKAVPVPKDATNLRSDAPVLMERDAEGQTFQFLETSHEGYTVQYYRATYSLMALLNATVSKRGEYLQVPQELAGRIASLARFVVANKTTPYEEVISMQEFVKATYTYSQDYPETTKGADPVDQFLFSSKRGVCGHFNSALVLMCRTMGIPARLVVGYHISPYIDNQVIDESMAHSYAEVYLEGQGWLIFDATPTIPESPELVENDIPPPPSSLKSVIWGHVFNDLDKDGVREDREAGLGMQSLFIEDRPGNVTMRSSSTWDGTYLFVNVTYGAYVLGYSLEEGWRNSTPLFLNITVGDSDDERPIDFGVYFDADLINGTIPTQTGLDFSSMTILKGRNFTVNGTVVDFMANKVSDMRVRIYLTPDKLDLNNRSLIGEGFARYGQFSIACLIPQSLPPADYQLVARAVTNFVYRGSESDPTVRVVDGTHLQVLGPAKIIEGTSTTLRIALVYNSTGQVVLGQSIGATGIFQGNLISGEFGRDRFLVQAGEPGNYSTHLQFAGTENLLPCETYFTVHAAKIEVTLDRDYMVRGESNVLIGRLHAEDLIVSNMWMMIYLDGVQNSYCLSTSEGLFAASFALAADHPLVDAPIEYQMFTGPIFSDVLRITARTTLRSEILADQIAVRLLDDKGQPLPDRPVLVQALEGNSTSLTDQGGYLRVPVGRGLDRNLTFVFQGERFLLPSSALVNHPAAFILPFQWVLMGIIASCLAVTGFMYYRKRPDLKQALASLLPVRPIRIKAGPYRVSFPQIAIGLPVVWSQEPLLLRVEGKGSGAQLWMDDVPMRGLTFREGSAESELLLVKGVHLIAIRGSQGETLLELRIVDYREEVVHMYKTSFGQLMQSHPGLSPDMTPREAQGWLANRLGADRLEHLESMTSLFEMANFSLSPVGRKEYERMFLSVTRVCS